MNQEAFIKVTEYANKYGITRQEAINRCKRSRVNYYRIGREYRIEDKDIIRQKPGKKPK